MPGKKQQQALDMAQQKAMMNNQMNQMNRMSGMSGFGSPRDMRDGISNVRTRVPREMDDEVLMNAGGYMGGSSMSGRGTMAGELGRKGSMSVREAGEDMNELSKRRRGMETGGGVKIGKPIKGTIGKPQKLYKEKKKKNK